MNKSDIDDIREKLEAGYCQPEDTRLLLAHIEALQAVADAAAAIKADASWFADDGKLRIDDTEFNALRDALKAVGE